MNILDPWSVREKIPLTDLLTWLGFRPDKICGDDFYYISMLQKDVENPKATFLVNRAIDSWFDKSLGKGGNIIDFGLAFWQDAPVQMVLEKISNLYNEAKARLPVHINERFNGRKRRAVKIPNYQISEIRPLGSNPDISSYLKNQGLWEISTDLIREVYYFYVDDKKKRKDFFSAGWKNENNGWEVRSENFSGCIGKEAMTFIEGSENHLLLFQEMYSYLTWKYCNNRESPSALILNHDHFVGAAIIRARKYQDVKIHFEDSHLCEELIAALGNTKISIL